MDYKEACDWLKGNRSTQQAFPREPFETLEVRTAQLIAAKSEEAYWVAKAHRESLLKSEEAENVSPDAVEGIFVATEGSHRRAGVVVNLDHLRKSGVKAFATNGRMFAAYNKKFTREEAENLLESMNHQCELEDLWKSEGFHKGAKK